MKDTSIQFDFESVAAYMKELVREKAIKANSTIVYMKDGVLIEEDPKTGVKRILEKRYSLDSVHKNAK